MTDLIQAARQQAAKKLNVSLEMEADMIRREQAGLRIGDVYSGVYRYAGGNSWEVLDRETGKVVKTAELPEAAKQQALIGLIIDAGRFGFGG